MQLAVVVGSLLSIASEQPVVAPLDAFIASPVRRAPVALESMSSSGRLTAGAGLISSLEPRLGVPTFFWSVVSENPRYAKRGLSPVDAARRYLSAHAELYRASPSRWAEAEAVSVHDLHDGSAVIVTFEQRLNGTRLFRDQLKVIMNAQLQLVALAGYLTPELEVHGRFALGEEVAALTALSSLTGRPVPDGQLSDLGLRNGGYHHFGLADAELPVRTRPVYFPMPDGVVPGFYVELETTLTDGEGEHAREQRVSTSMVVSAVDGAILFRKNLIAADAYTYSVWADPTTKLPHDGPQGTALTPLPSASVGAVTVTPTLQSLVTLEHAGLSTNDAWLPPMALDTRGNNVSAYADVVSRNGLTAGSDVLATVTDGGFDFPYDFSQDPESEASRKAAVTQLFYDTNFFHDWYYDDGFTEAAGNGQRDNLGRGGLGNDPLLAEAQDYSGRDNANMSTPADGQSPRMQMYVFDGDGSGGVVLNQQGAPTFSFNTAAFGPQRFNVTAQLVLANDGDSTPTDGCGTPWPMPQSFAGKVVLIDRGTCTFQEKALHAQEAGAAAVIIANNAQGGAMFLASSPGVAAITIPAMAVSRTGGTTLKTAITSNPAVTVTLSRDPTVNRDGTLDNGIVAHEWGHFISNRLIGDGNGISNLQAVGMGEGWADFHAALLLVREEDALVPTNANWAGVYSLAAWASSAYDPNAFYFGFRRYPLSTDLRKNPLTFRHIQEGVALPNGVPVAFGASGSGNAEVHATGEVWAVMLWECYAALLKDSRYTFSQAQARMKRYLVAAYKATPLMPTFVDARDAVLAVAAANDQQDFTLFWNAFARRGMGMGATAPDRDSQDNRPVTESFTVGNDLDIVSVALTDSPTSCDRDGRLDAFESGELTLTVRNIGLSAVSTAMVTVSTSAPGVTFPAGASATLPMVAPFATTQLKVPVALGDVKMPQAAMFQISIADASLARGPVTRQAAFRLNYDLQPLSSRRDDVEAPMAQWTAGSDPRGNTGSDFRIFQSSPTQHFWFGPNPASPADTWLISPPLQVGTGDFSVTFSHRWDFEEQNGVYFDGAVIEVSSDGTTWTDVGASSRPGYVGVISDGDGQSANPLGGQRGYVGKSVGYPLFLAEKVSLGTTYAGKTVRLRFRIGADDAAGAKGWEIDDIQFDGIVNAPFTAVASDPNTCTNRAPVAAFGPGLEVDERAPVTLTAQISDADADPVTQTWTQTSGPLVELTDASFVAPEVTGPTVLTFELTVSDGRAVVRVPGELTVTVRDVNLPPVAGAPAALTVQSGAPVELLGSGTDPEGAAVTFEWTQLSGTSVALEGATTDTLRFTAPAGSETLRFSLVVSDGVNVSPAATVDVTVQGADGGNEPGPSGCGCNAVDFSFVLVGLLAWARRSRGAGSQRG